MAGFLFGWTKRTGPPAFPTFVGVSRGLALGLNQGLTRLHFAGPSQARKAGGSASVSLTTKPNLL